MTDQWEAIKQGVYHVCADCGAAVTHNGGGWQCHRCESLAYVCGGYPEDGPDPLENSSVDDTPTPATVVPLAERIRVNQARIIRAQRTRIAELEAVVARVRAIVGDV